MHIKDIRRKNLRALAKAVSGVTALANRLDKAQSQISHLIGSNPCKRIGDKMAAHIERVFNKPAGWLDQVHEDGGSTVFSSSILSAQTRVMSLPVVPLIPLSKIDTWKDLMMNTSFNHSLTFIPIKINTVVSNQAYALQIDQSAMEIITGCFSPQGCIFIIEPKQTIANQAFILVRLKNRDQFLLGWLVIKNNKRYLKSFNQYLSTIEITELDIIYGTVLQFIVNCY
jgi:SOS-response transcriptional repressor LexA